MIAPGETLAFVCKIRVARPGPFSGIGKLHVADPSLRTIEFSVHGIGVAPERPALRRPFLLGDA